jgi:hypothetical protein
MSGPKVGEDVLLQSRQDFTRARSWMDLGSCIVTTAFQRNDNRIALCVDHLTPHAMCSSAADEKRGLELGQLVQFDTSQWEGPRPCKSSSPWK